MTFSLIHSTVDFSALLTHSAIPAAAECSEESLGISGIKAPSQRRWHSASNGAGVKRTRVDLTENKEEKTYLI